MARYGEHIKQWKKHFGKIPKDKNGRSYEIHHLDGNIENNNIDNLICVSIEEHYNIHKKQGDYGGAFLIAGRMKIKPEDISEVASKASKERVVSGTHNFLDPNFPRSLDHNRGFVVAKNTLNGETIRVSKEEFDNNDNLVGINSNRKQKTVHSNRGQNKGKKWKIKNKEIGVKCNFCEFVGRASLVSRWHNDNCKDK